MRDATAYKEASTRARQFNAGRRWNRPGKIPVDPVLLKSPSVRNALDGMVTTTGCSREDAEDALMRAHNLGEILTPEELAKRLKVPSSWVYDKQRTRCKNKIPSKPMGRYIRFDWDEVVKWLEAQSNIAPNESKSATRKKRD
jgi:excisionase family DNA binding protein